MLSSSSLARLKAVKRLFSTFTTSEVAAFRDQFEQQGFVHFRGLFDAATCSRLKDRMSSIIADQFHGSSSIFTTEGQERVSDEYFLSSGDKIRFFMEEGMGADQTESSLMINKVGHNLHDLDEAFRAYSYDTKIEAICRDIVGVRKPLLVQSMYIMKNPKVGGKVDPHQDGTFLITDPPSTFGLWLALDKATEANGCLWAVPGSHRDQPISFHFHRVGDDTEGTRFEPADLSGNLSLEGAVPLEAEVGDLVLLDGGLVHFSHHNSSSQPRHAYTLHIVEGEEGYEYVKENWLQRESFNEISA